MLAALLSENSISRIHPHLILGLEGGWLQELGRFLGPKPRWLAESKRL